MESPWKKYKHPIHIKDKKSLQRFRSIRYHIHIDAFERQIKELFLIENPIFVGEPRNKVFNTKEFKAFSKERENDFEYIYYPWNNALVKSVKSSDYFRLKTNRNCDLITSEEQKKLYKYKISVLGMSVGSNIAFVLTQAGISQEIILADFDELDTSNLNRILAGVYQTGLNKAIIAARRIYEDNPYAKVSIFTNGMDKNHLEKLLREKKVDCIIEEIDQMQMKIDTRILALKYKIPVLMVTDNGDRAVLHIERYDLGYKKIFGKEISYWDRKMMDYSGKKDFADIVINDIIGGPERVDPNMLASAWKVVEKKLVSWPQLGSSALLGGVAVTIAIKNIVAGRDKRLFAREYLKILE